MLKITNVKVYDLKESIIASGNAMRTQPVEYTDEEFNRGLDRMKKLVKACKTTGINCHDNALTGIRVSFDIQYPQYWTPEFQRYHFVDIVTSSSKMHRLSKMNLNTCCNEYVDKAIIDKLQALKDEYNRVLGDGNITCYNFFDERARKIIEYKTREDVLYFLFMRLVSNCPLGLELFMRVSTNYKQLQTIYRQRKDHKLKEDWGAFCAMIEELPYFEELIK